MNKISPELIRRYFKKRPNRLIAVTLIIIGLTVIYTGFASNQTETFQIALVTGAVLVLTGLIRLLMRLG